MTDAIQPSSWSRVSSVYFYQRVSVASYSSAGIAREEMSVCLSHSGIVSKRRKLYSVMISSPYRRACSDHSSFWKYLDHREVRKGSPRATAIYEAGWVRIGKSGDFSTNRPPYLRNGARSSWLLLITNRKSHPRFRLVQKSSTLDDPELMYLEVLLLSALLHYTHMSFGAHHKKMNEDRPLLSATTGTGTVVTQREVLHTITDGHFGRCIS